MGPINVGMWNELGIKSMKTVIVPFVSHPCSPDQRLYFLADPPHLLKNLWNCLLTHTVELAEDVMHKYGLPSRIIDSKYVKSLMDLQAGHSLRLAYKLNKSHVNPTQYEKMRVSLAAQFLSRSTAAALEVCVRRDLLPVEALTTAWFLNFVNDWFDTMNARHKQAAIFGSNIDKTSVLDEMLVIIQGLSFSGKKIWKPIQSGIKLSTTVALSLSKEMIQKHNLQYFLPGRLSQDPVENLFSQVRGRGVSHPSCVMFRQTLRLISVAQFLAVPKSAAYDADGCTYLVNYLKDRKRRLDSNDQSLQLSVTVNANDASVGDANDTVSLYAHDCLERSSCPELVNDDLTVDTNATLYNDASAGDANDAVPQYAPDCLEPSSCAELVNDDIVQLAEVTVLNTASAKPEQSRKPAISPARRTVNQTIGELESTALYDVVGWAVSQAIKNVNCDACNCAFINSNVENDVYSCYTSARSYGGLTHPNKDLFCAMKLVESVVQYNIVSFACRDNMDEDIVKQAVDVLDTAGYFFPSCHDLLTVILRKYVRMRIHEHATSYTRKKSVKRQYGSKTACRNTSIL